MRDHLAARVERLEESRRLGLPVAATRRFFEIEGLDLGGLLALELFTTVIPLVLIGFSWVSDFSESLSFGDTLIRWLRLEGDTAQQVRELFGTSASLRSTWTVLGLAGFLVWGIPMASQVAKTFARAFRRERFGFWTEVWRGSVWFCLFLSAQAATLTITTSRAHDVVAVLMNIVGWIPGFLLWSATPAILVRHGSNGWRHLAWCGVAGVALDTIVTRAFIRFVVPPLLDGWVGFGPIGVAMAMMTLCTVVAAMWVAIACLGAVLWERNAPADTVIASQHAELVVADGVRRRR